ncbi:PucR family transcriptional regulator [Saccharopolyspora terrae]|uniref:PucR family transcriptional regulator n=1 Tax=Saccharopolyspora terrae TaxID=2530384 RepID=A0A4R4VIG0_9PSEU|nr:PucR family transcriptional regulator [Saccharopolyspora terrae]
MADVPPAGHPTPQDPPQHPQRPGAQDRFAAGPRPAPAPRPGGAGPRAAAARFTGGARPSGDLDELLHREEVRRWADRLLAPLRDSPQLLETVWSWLLADARSARAAEALGISSPALRKRLIRAEQLLERSLLHSPSLSYDLHLAFRALDEIG